MRRGKPFEPGNNVSQGRPLGSRNKKTLIAEEFQKEGVLAVRTVKRLALEYHDIRALKIWTEHLYAKPGKPIRHNRFRLPPMKTSADLANAVPAIMQEVAAGRISAQDGEAFARTIQIQQRMIESVDFEKRLRSLEENHTGTSIRSDSVCPADQDAGEDSPVATRDADAKSPTSSSDPSMISSAVENCSVPDGPGNTSENPEGQCS